MFKSLKNAFSKLFTAKKSENRELTELTTDTTTVIANGYRVQAWWLEIAALLLELFAIALVVSWAWHSQSYWLLATICVGAFIGFEIARVYTVPLLVNAVKAKHYGMVVLGFILVFATLLVLFAATVFENVNKADDGVNEKVLNSPAMKALELEINQTNARISGLAEFSNPNKAHAEMQDLKGKEQTRLAKIEKLKADINGFMSGTPKNKQGESAGNSLTALTNGCKINNWYAQTYCPQVKQKQDELKSLEGNSLTGDASYNKKYDEYNGLQTHLTSLEKRRAELLTSQGEGVINAYKPEDTLIASLFEISAQKASFIKWLVLSAVLDLLGLGLRFLASMARFRASGIPDVNAATREYARKLKAYATLYGVNGLQDLFDRQTQVIYHDKPTLAAPTHGPSARSQQATPPVIANNFAVTAQTTDSQPTMQSTLAETMTAKTTDSYPPVAMQPLMQSTLAEMMQPTKTDIIYNGLFLQEKNTRTLISLGCWNKEISDYDYHGLEGVLEKNTSWEVNIYATKTDDVFLSNCFLLGNDIDEKMRPESQGSFVGVKYKRLSTDKLSNHFYLNVLSFKKVVFAIETRTTPIYKKTLEFADKPTPQDIENCVEIFLSQEQEKFIDRIVFTFDKEGYATLIIYFKHFELSNLSANQRQLMVNFLERQNKVKEFVELQKLALTFEPKKPEPVTKKVKKVWDIDDDIEIELDDDDVVESPVKEKQSFIGFVPPSNAPANKPKASDDSQVLGLAENPTNVVINDSRDTTVVNTNVVYTSVVGDVGTCPTCGSTFTRRNKRHKYCCEECRVKAHGFESKSQMMRTMGKAKKTTV